MCIKIGSATSSCTQSSHEVPLRPADDPDCSIPAVGPPRGLRDSVAAVGVRGCARSLSRADPSECQLSGAHRQELLRPVHDRARRWRPGWASELTEAARKSREAELAWISTEANHPNVER
jgi:hypothetical protein